MLKKKEILGIVIVIGVLLVLLFSLRFWGSSGVIELLKGFLALMLGILQWWALLVKISVPPAGVVIIYKYLARAFRDVKLIKHEKEYTCQYPPNPIWQNKRIIRGIVRILTPWGRYAKAIKNYDECVKSLYSKIASFLADGIKKGQRNIIIWDDIGERPSMDYVDLQKTKYSIKRGTTHLTEKREDDGIFRLLALPTSVQSTHEYATSISRSSVTIAKLCSESNKNWLRDFIESMANDDEIKELVKNCEKAEQDKNDAERTFKKKFAKIVSHVRDWDVIFSFRRYRNANDEGSGVK